MLLGIIDTTGEVFHWKMVASKYICLITPIFLLVPLIAFLIVNIRDVAQATSAFYLICIASMGTLTHIEYLVKRSIFYSIVDDLQYIIDHSVEGFERIYEKCSEWAKMSVKIFTICSFSSIFGVVSIPLLLLITRKLTGISVGDEKLPASLL